MDEFEESVEYMIKCVNREEDMFQSSYHGPNCRTCNRWPSYLRRWYWRIEDLVWRLK